LTEITNENMERPEAGSTAGSRDLTHRGTGAAHDVEAEDKMPNADAANFFVPIFLDDKKYKRKKRQKSVEHVEARGADGPCRGQPVPG